MVLLYYDGLETTITLRTGSDTITTRTKMNAWGELVESEDNIGNTVFNSYYPDGKLKESYVSEHSTSQKTEFTYDAQGNRTSISDPDAGTITSLYDGFGKLVRQISAKGDTSTYVYDDIGRASVSNDQRGNLYYSYIADDTNLAFGNPDSIYNGDKSLLEVYEYESDYGRLVSGKRTQVGKTFTHTYVYDWFGRPLTRTYPSGFEVRYAYTSNGDLEKVTGGGFTLWSCSDVNALGQITAYSQGANSTSLSYDMHGVLNHVTTGSIVDMQYGFDDLGNLTLREDALTIKNEKLDGAVISILVFCSLLFINTLTLLLIIDKLFDYSVELKPVYGLVWMIILIMINFTYFLSRKRYIRINMVLSNMPKQKRKMNSIIVLIYSLFSIVIFFILL